VIARTRLLAGYAPISLAQLRVPSPAATAPARVLFAFRTLMKAVG